jgi:hypothetical protein
VSPRSALQGQARWRLASLLLAFGLCTSHGLHAQTRLEYDHAAGTMRMITTRGSGVDTTVVRNGAHLTLNAPATVPVLVTNTNTALYRLSTKGQAVPAPELEPLRTFLATLRPYLPEVALLAAGPADRLSTRGLSSSLEYSILPPSIPPSATSRVRTAWLAGRRTELAVAQVDEAIFGASGMHQALTNTLLALQGMRVDGDVAAHAATLRRDLGLSGNACEDPDARAEYLPGTLTLIRVLDELLAARHELLRAIAVSGGELRTFPDFPGLADSLARITTASQGAATDYEKLVTVAYRVQALALEAAYACPSWSGDALRVTSAGGVTLTLTVEPRTEAELARVATQRGSTFQATVMPAWRMRPGLGASLLVAPEASYSKFATRTPETGSGTEIFQSGTQDSRFTWGITLGMAWRALSRGEGDRPDVALWLPEITVNPAADTRALGLGAAVSWRFLKLGTGLLWTRHSELEGQSVGESLPNKDFLRTRDTYASPKVYLSLSIFDWPPFGIK